MTRWMALYWLAAGCRDAPDQAVPRDPATAEPAPDYVADRAIRRLSVAEYTATVRELLGDPTFDPAGKLPEDFLSPFDDDATTQVPSRVLIEVTESLARDAAKARTADPAALAAWLPCAPQTAHDEACMSAFVGWFGRRALHRPLTTEEAADFTDLGLAYADRTGGFSAGVEVLIRALLQDPEFLYRIEVGTPVDGHPGVVRLDDYEIAARLALLLWGAAPDDALLDRADRGELETPEQREDAAREMLTDPRAIDQVDRFHAMWLGYQNLSVGLVSYQTEDGLAAAMRAETRALVERVVFDDDAPWTQLLLSTETYLTPQLSEHYGIPGDGWTDVSSTGRSGILGQGSFLATAGNVLDTSPTKRGKLVRERLMCLTIPPPPVAALAESPPAEADSDCKVDQYAAHRSDPTCAGCHELLDPVGFGLERFDLEGRYRTHDYWSETTIERKRCPIDGVGEVSGLGTFEGPAGLAQLLVDADAVQGCAVQQLVQYANGGPNETADLAYASDLAEAWPDQGLQLDELLVDLVSSDSFAYRKEE